MFTPFSSDWFRRLFPDARSIALVGNGPSAGIGAHGARIDGCDVVTRMNGYRVAGFADAVGHRTDLYFSHLLHTYDVARLRRDGVQGVVVSRPAAPAFAFNAGLGIMLRNVGKLGGLPVAWVSDDVFGHLYDVAGIPRDDRTGRNPSTGAVALALLSSIEGLDEILLTGFDGFAAAGNSMHYFADDVYDTDEKRALVARCHPTAVENDLMAHIMHPISNRFTVTHAVAERLKMTHLVQTFDTETRGFDEQ
ncbi:MAG: glycosyltransferase family 29 protein [Conexibacter sp.]